jgi:cytochrome oxidase assembly protein ShyY1
MPIPFRFRLVPLIAMLIVAAIGIALGNWQLRRADEKRAIEAKLTAQAVQAPLSVGAATLRAEDIEYRRVSVQGEFERAWPLYLDNRPLNGNAGFYLLMPFKIAGTDRYVLIERGWFPVDPHNRSKLPAVNTPEGTTTIEGVAIRGIGHVLQLGQAAPVQPGAILQNLTVDELHAASKFDLQPFVIEQSSDTHDGLKRDWPRSSVGIERHLGYAFQWYALAATAFLFFVVTGYRSGRKQRAGQ